VIDGLTRVAGKIRASRFEWLLGGVVACLLIAGGVRAEAEAPLEVKVKAACLYNFAKFVEFPAEKFATADAPMVIGVVGDDPFGNELDEIVRGRTAQDRRVAVKRYKSADEAAGAHIVYVNLPERDKQAKALDALRKSHTLTVGDHASFLADGGAVRFTIRDNKVAFDIDPEVARSAGLKVSSHLLRLARVVGARDR
jgi:hypothetical protein